MTPEQPQKQKNMAAAGLTPAQQAGVTSGKGYSPTGATPVPNASLQAATPITTPPVSTTDTLTGAVNATSADLIAAQGAVDTAQTQRTTDVNQYQTLSNQLLGKSADQLAAEQAQGIPEYNKQLNELQNISRQKLIEYNMAPQLLSDQVAGRGVTAGGLAPQISARRNTLAVDIMLNNSNIQAMQGNIALAQQTVDRAISAKYDPIEAKLKTQKDIIDMNYQDLSRADKKVADAKTAQLTLQAQELADKKAQEKEINNVVLEAAKNGADATVLNNIRKATNTGEAIAIAGNTLRGVTTDVVKLDNGQTVVIDKATGNVIRNLGGAKTTGGGTLTELQGNLDAYSQRFAADGQLPSPAELKAAGLTVGQVTERAKSLPKPKGALVSTHTGVAPKNLSATESAGITAMNEIVTQTLPELKRLFPKLYTGVLGGIGGAIYTTQDRQDYETFRQEFLSKLLVARSGATVTPQEYDRYSKLLPGSFNQMLFMGSTGEKKLESLSKSMNTNLNSILATKQLSIYGHTPVKLGGKEYKVGDTIEVNGIQGQVLPDGTIAIQ